MLKKSIALCLIYSIFLLANFPLQISGQNQNKISNEPPAEIKKGSVDQPKPNVKTAFEKEISSSRFEIEKTTVDFKKIEKDQYKQPQKKKGLTKNEKTFLVVFIVALTVGVILLAKYAKIPKCSEVSCNPDFDEDCICEK